MKSVGIDIAKVSRFYKKDNLCKRFLSINEWKYYKDQNFERKAEYAAGRWAAKEAYIKCTQKNVKFFDLTVKFNSEMQLYYKDNYLQNIKLSISHEKKDYAIAIVIKII